MTNLRKTTLTTVGTGAQFLGPRSREFNLQDLHGIPRELALLGGAAVVFQFSQGGNGIFQDPS